MALSAISVPQFLQIIRQRLYPHPCPPWSREPARPVKLSGDCHRPLSRTVTRWRRAFIAACLPYLLLSVFVDFLHVHPAVGTGRAARPSRRCARRPTVPSSQSSRLPDNTCAVCQWLRMGTRLQPSVAVATALGIAPGGRPRRCRPSGPKVPFRILRRSAALPVRSSPNQDICSGGVALTRIARR